MRPIVFFLVGLFVLAGFARAQEGRTPTPTPTPEPAAAEPIMAEPEFQGYRRVPAEGTKTPTPTATPVRNPRLVAAIESEQGLDFERVALFDDGRLVLIQRYRGRGIPRYKQLAPSEVDVVRRVVREALVVPSSGGAPSERSVADQQGRRLRLEVAREDGSVWMFASEDMAQMPLPVGRAQGAMEDLRSRFFRTDPKETAWDPSGVKAGDLLLHRIYAVWYRVVRDDMFEPSLELEEISSIGARMLIARGQLPSLFESPALAPPTPTPGNR